MKTFNLPQDHEPYIDKYFLRSKEILQKSKLNPIVKLQVFIRNANCKIYGIDEAIAIINKYAPTAKINAIKEGDFAENCETIMLIEAPIQHIIDLETMYLGVISAETTLHIDNKDIDLDIIKKNMSTIVEIVKPRTVMYFGARHWRFDRDAEISNACFEGGAKSCSTDIGAKKIQSEGVGTIPHALETIFHWRHGVENAVNNATMEFDKYIDSKVPRIALIDYANHEMLDSLTIARQLGKKLFGVRIDTCGENYMQGVLQLLYKDTVYKDYYTGKGVSVYGVYLVRKLLNDNGREDVRIILSSGFANPEKTQAFVDAEKELGIQLFDSLGVGQVFYSRVATGDIVEVEGREIHKVGRPYRPNKRLERII